MNKILLVSNGFYPEISPRSFRATELAMEFARQGHDVMVYSKHREYDYADFLKENNIRFNMWRKPRFPSIPILKGKAGKLLTRALTRLFLMLFEYPGIEDMFNVKHALRKENGYDLLISFAVPFPVHWGVAWVRTKNYPIAEVWVADCGDPYMGCETDTFKKLFYFKFIEKWWSRKADFITIPVESAQSAYYSEFYPKIKIIPQGFKLIPIPGSEEPVNNEIPTFAYVGTFIPGIRDPGKFLDYLTTLDQPFRFIIYTNDDQLLDTYLKPLNGKMIIKEYIARSELLKMLTRLDFLVNFDNNTSVQIPSKLIDYALANRPVLNIDSNFKPEIVDEFLDANYEHQFVVPDIEKYNISNVAKQFLELIPNMK